LTGQSLIASLSVQIPKRELHNNYSAIKTRPTANYAAAIITYPLRRAMPPDGKPSVIGRPHLVITRSFALAVPAAGPAASPIAPAAGQLTSVLFRQPRQARPDDPCRRCPPARPRQTSQLHCDRSYTPPIPAGVTVRNRPRHAGNRHGQIVMRGDGYGPGSGHAGTRQRITRCTWASVKWPMPSLVEPKGSPPFSERRPHRNVRTHSGPS
jgi:hypothetical protein